MDEKTDNLIKENKGVLRQLTYLNNEVKKMKRSKYQALLNNCVDDDEAILHKREIEEVNLDGY
ncbi:hypothetical protein KAX02_05500 [candidate division WOR-3 bacterium]|nr:hypothetical protein [candidate division WOR-3 bacterium]